MAENEPKMFCYCKSAQKDGDMLQCEVCENFFHTKCLKTCYTSSLRGDVFYHLKCANCTSDGNENCSRLNLQWMQVVYLALYNLQLQSTGKYGFFRWKEDICEFIARHWTVFFGHSRKKSQTWRGTVAGTLSANCPQFFTSGTHILKESGWWSLTHVQPPTIDMMAMVKSIRRQKRESDAHLKEPIQFGARTRGVKSSLQAAIELRAKKDVMIQLGKGPKLKGERRKSEDSLERHSPSETGTEPVYSPTKIIPSCSAFDATQKMEASISPVCPVQEINSTFWQESATSAAQLVPVLPTHDSFLQLQTDNSNALADQPQSASSSALTDLWLEGEEDCSGDLELDPNSISPQHASPGSQSPDGLPHLSTILAGLQPSEDTLEGTLSPASVLHTDSSASASMVWTNTDSMPTIYIPDPEGIVTASVVAPSVSDAWVSYADNTEETQLSTQVPLASSPMSSSMIQENSKLPSIDDSTDTATEELSTERESLVKDIQASEVISSCADPTLGDNALSRCSTPQSESETKSEIEESEDLRTTSKKRKHTESEDGNEQLFQDTNCECMSVSDEKRLLNKLEIVADSVVMNAAARRLHAKLRLRQRKRERGLGVMNLDQLMYKLSGCVSGSTIHNRRQHQQQPGDYRTLDRYQLTTRKYNLTAAQQSFMTCLVGTEDDQLQSVCSPYTARTLKPFIWRDFTSRPVKMKLLMEIRAYPHKNEPSWCPNPLPPIDYCYIRPQHIASVNALCRQFFWPGIDLSECLQYPDFTCVVLYRKFVIGFAMMVPDVKYNEAYISFLFTHPEWRGAGIATFMVYHLIQTCMGKDVTLHVSASNPAMILYQKFGFKPEQFILNFYDKYFPEESNECRHAYFLRLRR